MNNALLALNKTELPSLASATTQAKQVVAALDFARQYINGKGSFPWDQYWGSIITTDGVKTYDLSPINSNYMPTSRTTSSATLVNVTVLPMNKASFDSTFNLSKCTATGASPSVTKTSLATLQGGRISASVWLAADTTNDPGTITLTLTDGSGAQSVSTTITNDGSLNRYGISGYFDTSSTTVKLKVSWTSATGIVYLDGWQAELCDYVSPYINNTSASDAQSRVFYVDPTRVFSAATYRYGTQMSWQDICILDESLLRDDYTTGQNTYQRYYSMHANRLTMDNVEAGTHLIFRGIKRAPSYTTADDTTLVDIPQPDIWTVIQGIVAFVKAARYDIGANRETPQAMQIFESMVNDMLISCSAFPGYGAIETIRPVMTI